MAVCLVRVNPIRLFQCFVFSLQEVEPLLSDTGALKEWSSAVDGMLHSPTEVDNPNNAFVHFSCFWQEGAIKPKCKSWQKPRADRLHLHAILKKDVSVVKCCSSCTEGKGENSLILYFIMNYSSVSIWANSLHAYFNSGGSFLIRALLHWFIYDF